MADANAAKAYSHKTHHHSLSSSSHHHRNTRPENPRSAADPKLPPQKPSSNPNPKPTPKPAPNSHPNPIHPKPTSGPPRPDPGPIPTGPPPPPLPSYGFHMLERRTISLADGSARSYFALPPDYHHHPPPLPRHQFPPRFPPMSPEMGDPYLLNIDSMGKRKFENERELAIQRRHLLQFGNLGTNQNGEFSAGPSNFREINGLISGVDEFRMGKQMRLGGDYQGSQFNSDVNKHREVDQIALKKAFLHFVKSINENSNQIKFYMENGKQSKLHCLACDRSARSLPDMHALIIHTYNPEKEDQLVDHLGFHKALCILMGWNYLIIPDNSKAYQSLSADEAEANKDDVILWPPMVIVYNTITGKSKEGRMEGLGNKAMDIRLREIGCTGGKAKAIYGREGHMGITLVKFSGDKSGLKEAEKLADFLERENHGRRDWARVQSSSKMGKKDENNPNLMDLNKSSGEKQRILYGYLGTVFDLDKLDFETRKKISIESRRDYGLSK